MDFPLYLQIFLGQWEGVILEMQYGLFRVFSPPGPLQVNFCWVILEMQYGLFRVFSPPGNGLHLVGRHIAHLALYSYSFTIECSSRAVFGKTSKLIPRHAIYHG